MVAITVILAAVIGAFVMGIGQDASTQSKSASFSVDVDQAAGNVTLTHDGGDSLQSDSTKIIIENDTASATWSPAADGQSFAVGDEVEFNVTLNSNGDHDIDGWNLALDSSSFPQTSFESGDQITVRVIDTNSQRTIFETEVTA